MEELTTVSFGIVTIGRNAEISKAIYEALDDDHIVRNM
jgi:hypothetical protein